MDAMVGCGDNSGSPKAAVGEQEANIAGEGVGSNPGNSRGLRDGVVSRNSADAILASIGQFGFVNDQ